ncbi:MAG: MFS transporter, partial [Proteobacteria bacterium]|nr:MFS transporter [Pseudomonadota bacterium]
KQEFKVSDTLLGLLGGLAFALFYATLGIPVARWADRGNRRTIITAALTVWSCMTALCGMAHTFVQLLLARVGVGAGEAGAISPAQSLIVDYFPPERRATAIGIFTSAAMAGYLLGFTGGGWLASTYGWRVTFLWVGLPGLVLALLVRMFLAEPRITLGFPAQARHEPLSSTLALLWNKRSYRLGVMGCCAYFFMAYGALIFIPSFLIRVQHLDLKTVSVAYGGVSAIASLAGTLGGGWLADRLARRDVRWLAWIPAIACAIAGPLEVLFFAVDDFRLILVIGFVNSALLSGGLPPVFAAIHAVCGSLRRATAISLLFFAASLFGNGLGPLVAGALSDALSALYGADGLRYSLQLLMSVLIVTAALFFGFGRAMPSDLES